MKIMIRNEQPTDYRRVEELTRNAFWNLHVPGCDEHLLVHKLRDHPDFIKELDFVAINYQEIIAHIMFSTSALISISEHKYPCCLLAKELTSGILAHHQWQFHESKVFIIDPEELEAFDRAFAPFEKETRYTQDIFAILSHAYLE